MPRRQAPKPASGSSDDANDVAASDENVADLSSSGEVHPSGSQSAKQAASPAPEPDETDATPQFEPTLRRTNRGSISGEHVPMGDPVGTASNPDITLRRTSRSSAGDSVGDLPSHGSEASSGSHPPMTLRRGGRQAGSSDGSHSSLGDAPTPPPPPTQVERRDQGPRTISQGTVADQLGIGAEAAVHLPSQRRVAPSEAGAAPQAVSTGRYDVHGEIGRGGMGAVLTAQDRDLGREVAMKVILDASDPETLVRFTREAQISGQLEHPNITPVHELGLDPQGRVYFTMKLVRGDSLTKKLNDLKKDVIAGKGEESFPLAKRLQIFTKMCEALAYAHNRGVIHRDLKPDNIMVGEFGEVHVMDWGLARLIGEEDDGQQGGSNRTRGVKNNRGSGRSPQPMRSQQITLADDDAGAAYRTLEGDVMGTPNYMAPEQARGEVSTLDGRADIFALGVILYEMMTLCRAFDGTNVERILKDVENARFLEPRKRVERDKRLAKAGLRVPRELEAIVLKAMAKDPRRRYRTASELAEDVDAYLHGRATTAADYSPLQLAYIWVRSNKLKTTITAAFVLLAVSAVFVFEWAQAQARQEQLQPYRNDVAAAQASLDELRAAIAEGEYVSALEMAEGFEGQHGARLVGVANAAMAIEYMPDLVERAESMVDDVAEARLAAIRGWVDAQVAALPDPTSELEPDAIEQARAMRREFALYLEEPSLAELPVTEFAYWQAQVAIERGDPSLLAEAVADAFMLQPQSFAAGRTFLLQASDTLARCLALEAGADPTLAALQYHMALSAFGEAHPRLRPEALLGLSHSLALMSPRDRTPFDTDVRTREMSLRALLELIGLDGELRPEMRDVLEPEQREELGQQARDLLYALRRTTVTGPAVQRSIDTNNDGIHDGVSSTGGDMARFRRPVPPEEPGLDPHRWETVRETSIEGIVSRLMPGERTEDWRLTSHVPVHFMPDQDEPGALFLFASTDESSNGLINRIFLTTGLDGSGEVYSFAVRHFVSRVRHVATADFNGNGLTDVVIAIAGTRAYETRSCRIFVAFQSEPGRFGDHLELADPGSEFPGFHSEIRGMIAEDLNGDGQPEILLSFGEWQKLSLQVYEYLPSSHHFASMYEQRVGDGNPMLIHDPGSEQPLIAISSPLPFTISFFFEMRGEPIESEDIMFFRYIDGQLERLDHPVRETPMRNNSVRLPSRLLEGDDGERVLVASGTSPLDYVMRFHHYRGSMLAPDELRTTLVASHHELHPRSHNEIDGYLTLHSGGSYRTLRDEDLVALTEQPVPTDPPQRDEAAIVAIVGILLAAELHDEAVRVIREVSEEESRQEVLDALVQLEMLALIDAQRYDDVVEVVRSLTPSRNLVADVLFVTQTLADLGRFRDAYELLEPWSISTERTARQRDEIDEQRRAWRSLAELYEELPRDEIRGFEVYRGGDEPEHLADYMLSNSPHVMRVIPDERRTTNWYVTGPERTWLGQRTIDDPDALRPRGVRPAAGIPMRLGTNSYRITAEFRLPGVPYDTHYAVGPQPVRHLLGRDTSYSSGIRLHSGGGNHINDLRINRHMRVDRRLGNRLRIDLIYMRELDRTRVILSDLDEGEILYEQVRNGQLIRPGITLFGIAGGRAQNDTRSEFELHYLGLQGDARLLRANDNDVLRELIESPTILQTSRALQHQLRGEWDEARQLYLELVEQLERIAERGERAEELRAQAQHYLIEAARCTAQGDVRRLGHELLELLHEERVTMRDLAEWLRAKPHYRGDPDLWPGVGRAIGQWLYPGRNSRAALAEALEEDNLDPLILAVILAWAHDDDPNEAGIHQMMIRATFDTVSRYSSGIYWGTNPLGWRLLEVIEHAPPEIRTTTREMRFVHGAILGAMQRRPDALNALDDDDPTPFTGFRLLQDRLIERAKQNEESLQRQAAHGFNYDRLPPTRH